MVEYNINLEGKTILVTGAAGFIGSNLVKRLFHDVQNIKVIGIDSITDYYDVNIKHERLKEIEEIASSLNRETRGGSWTFVHASIADKEAVEKIFTENKIAVVVNLAAQAGVRYSITNPDAYIQSNLIGFYNILEACRHHEVEHLVYASSSSVYGSNKKFMDMLRVDNNYYFYKNRDLTGIPMFDWSCIANDRIFLFLDLYVILRDQPDKVYYMDGERRGSDRWYLKLIDIANPNIKNFKEVPSSWLPKRN